MLLGLHVKNLALIEKAEVEFAGGLNILTGETGAGKSIIIGSVGLALGAKASKDMIRQAPVETLTLTYQGLHVMSFEDAIMELKNIYRENNAD